MNTDYLCKAALLIATGQPIRGEVISRDEFNNNGIRIIIDTCFTNDTERYETAISVSNDKMIVVEEYETPQEAKIGHENWVKICKQKRFHFYDICTYTKSRKGIYND